MADRVGVAYYGAYQKLEKGEDSARLPLEAFQDLIHLGLDVTNFLEFPEAAHAPRESGVSDLDACVKVNRYPVEVEAGAVRAGLLQPGARGSAHLPAGLAGGHPRPGPAQGGPGLHPGRLHVPHLVVGRPGHGGHHPQGHPRRRPLRDPHGGGAHGETPAPVGLCLALWSTGFGRIGFGSRWPRSFWASWPSSRGARNMGCG